MSGDAQAPSPDSRRAAIDRIRATAKWLIVAFAAIGAALAGTTPLSNVGKLDVSSGRFWIAAAAAAVALSAIAAAIWAAAKVLLPLTRTLPELVEDDSVRAMFDTNFELLGGKARTLQAFKVRYDATRDQWIEAIEDRERTETPLTRAAAYRADVRFDEFSKPVDRIVGEGLLVTVRKRFRFAQLVMFAAALVAGAAIVAFTWAANPPSPSTATTTTVAVVVQTDPLGAGAAISRAAAAKLLRAHGLPAGDVLSFSGPIAAETLQPHRTLLRYASRPKGTGRFLTTARFQRPAVARSALHLPWANTASCRQDVQVKRRTLVLVGAIAFGKPGVLQYEVLEPNGFEFRIGNRYSAQACRE